ncbi:MAG: trigger factor [Actinomycetota bacterium]|nr:trigger factor [Actinomycetota bacterium]
MTPTATLSTSSEPLEKDRVKLRVEVPEKELDPALNAVYKRWSREIKLPGFRKGHVPRRLIDTHVGPEVIRQEALRDALPDLYRRALEAEDLEAIAAPEIEVVEFEPGTPLVFEATVDIRPEITLPDIGSLEVQAPPAEVNDDDLNEQLDRLRDRFAELETVGREARRGDHVLIDLNGYRHDQPVEGASAPDYLYEVGSRSGPPELDDELQGSRPGEILKFNSTLPDGAGELGGQTISFTVLVKEVKAKKLPDLDDEFAKTVGEFDSLDELKADLRTRLAEVKRNVVKEQTRALALEALVSAADLDPPEKLVGDEFQHRLEHFQQDLEQAGMTMEQYASASGSTELEIRADMRSHAERAVKAELLLEEIARTQHIEVTNEDLGREVALAAARAQREPREVAKELADSGRLGAVAADIMRRKALDYVVATANVVGREPAGNEDKDNE